MAWTTSDITNTLLPIAGGIAGSLNGAQEAGTTTVTQTPWKAAQPLLGGILGQAETLYNQTGTGMPDYLSQAYTDYLNNANTAMGGTNAQLLNSNIANVLQGAGQPQLSMPSFANAGNVNASTTSLSNELGALGAIDPSAAYQQMLTGQANTATLDPVVQTALNRMSDTFNQQIMPQINQQAVASGQDGGSRQGVAQGLATQNLANSMADTTANMYNNAYNTAQGLMGQSAGQLGSLAAQTGMANTNAANQAAIANANNSLQAQMANQNMMLGVNTQAMQNYNNQINALTGMGNLQNQINTNQASLGTGAINAANAANNYGWQQLGNLSSIAQPIGGMGGTTSQPFYNNPIAGGFAGAAAGQQYANYLNNQNTQQQPNP